MEIRSIQEGDIKKIALYELEISKISFGIDAITDIDFHKKKISKAIPAEKDFIGLKERFMQDAKTQIIIHKFSKKNSGRVFELIERTNKYNNIDKGIINENYILKYVKEESGNIIVIEMNDKYGEYGTIGTMLFKIIDKKMFIDAFGISCRVLGRGIPISIFSGIINKLFEEKKITEVICKIKYTKKNRESIILLDLLEFKLNKLENDIFEFSLNNKVKKNNKEFIDVIFKE